MIGDKSLRRIYLHGHFFGFDRSIFLTASDHDMFNFRRSGLGPGGREVRRFFMA